MEEKRKPYAWMTGPSDYHKAPVHTYRDHPNNLHLSASSDPPKAMAPTSIWSEVSSSSPVTLDDRLFARVSSSIQDLKRPPIWGPRVIDDFQPALRHSLNKISKQNKRFRDNDYSNNFIHTGEFPSSFVRNVKTPTEGYPKLQRLFHLKESQTEKYACTPFGSRVDIDDMIPLLNRWIHKDKLVFDVIMLGALTENQFLLPILSQLPLERLCSKPGFLFIWASAKKINELSGLLNSEGWTRKFRRSEELVFIPVDKDSPYYLGKDSPDDESLMENTQWHCWMCITGTVRRTSDGHLIHCNVDTDLKIENQQDQKNRIVPDDIYKVPENFSSATRRLHIIPSRSGYANPVHPRRGWVIMSPDIILDNFEPSRYKNEIGKIGSNVPQSQEIESIRPKSPVSKTQPNYNQSITSH